MSDSRRHQLVELVGNYNAAIKRGDHHAREAHAALTASDTYAKIIDSMNPSEEEAEAIGWIR